MSPLSRAAIFSHPERKDINPSLDLDIVITAPINVTIPREKSSTLVRKGNQLYLNHIHKYWYLFGRTVVDGWLVLIVPISRHL